MSAAKRAPPRHADPLRESLDALALRALKKVRDNRDASVREMTETLKVISAYFETSRKHDSEGAAAAPGAAGSAWKGYGEAMNGGSRNGAREH